MTTVLVRIWRLMRGTAQWYILWLAHRKFIIGVSGVVFNEQGQILLLRHRYWREGSWGLPSGYANRNEKLEDTLCREVKEETSLLIATETLLRIVSGYKLRLEVSYRGRLIGGQLHIDQREVLEVGFFFPDDLPQGLLSSHREIIALALQYGDANNGRTYSGQPSGTPVDLV